MMPPREPSVGDVVLCYFEAAGCALCWYAALVTGKPDPEDPMRVDLNVFPARNRMFAVNDVGPGDGSTHPAWQWRPDPPSDSD